MISDLKTLVIIPAIYAVCSNYDESTTIHLLSINYNEAINALNELKNKFKDEDDVEVYILQQDSFELRKLRGSDFDIDKR